MNITSVRAFTDNYIWCLDDERGFFCVDPGDAQPVIDFITEHHLNLHGIFITHHHMDHIGGTEVLVQKYPGIHVFAPNDSRIPYVTHPVSAKQNTLPYAFQVIEIPGHTSRHIAYYHADEQILFCGDTLFSGGCGRVFDGSMVQLHASLDKLKALPDETRVYCGHEYTQANLRFALHVEPDNTVACRYLETLIKSDDPCSLPSTIALEKEINPFFRLDAPSIIDYVEKKIDHKPSQFEIFECLRENKNKWQG